MFNAADSGMVLDADGVLPSVDMAEYVNAREYSKKDVVDAGKVITGKHPNLTQEVIEAFRIAHRWRDAYRYPMWRVRMELLGKVKRLGTAVEIDGSKPVTAGRLKRMQSIRRKLQRQRRTLYQLQDIGGCRVIFPNIGNVDALADLYRSGDCQHVILDEDDYIQEPRPSGYRSRHIIFKFSEKPYERQYIELQIRTRLQHAWATAVEAVGLVRNEDLKGGEGDRDWLRLFQLVAAEFALEEGKPLVPGISVDESDRRKELAELAQKLDAVRTLQGYRDAISYTDDFDPRYSNYFLIQFDRENRRVSVSTYNSLDLSSHGYELAENMNQGNAVLVEVDRVEDLKEAYPNYFLDVRIFLDKMQKYIRRSTPRSLDFSWLSDWRKRKPL